MHCYHSTGATCGTGTAYPSRTPEFTPGFECYSVFSFLRSVLHIIVYLLFVIHGIVAVPITVFIFSFQYKYRVNLSGSTVQTSEQLVKSKSMEYVNNYAFLCIVICILLIISGIEMNPGPSDSDLSSSFGSISSTSTTVSNFIHNSVSFLHLNIQSITPKLDLIAAEYSCHEILSFTKAGCALM